MKRLLAKGSMSTMRWFLLKVHRILAIFLCIAGMEVALFTTNPAAGMTSTECSNQILSGCASYIPEPFWSDMGLVDCGPAENPIPYCLQCGYYDRDEAVHVRVGGGHYCLPIYEYPEANKVSEPQSEHSCQQKASIIDIDNQIVGEDVAMVGTRFALCTSVIASWGESITTASIFPYPLVIRFSSRLMWQ